jgi:hypothetical protein
MLSHHVCIWQLYRLPFWTHIGVCTHPATPATHPLPFAPCQVMEYCDGGSLKDLIRRGALLDREHGVPHLVGGLHRCGAPVPHAAGRICTRAYGLSQHMCSE